MLSPQKITPRTLREIRETFSINLRSLLDSRSMKITDFSKASGISRTRVYRMLDAETFPRPDELITLCNIFNVDHSIYTQPLKTEQFTRHLRAWS